MVLIKKLFQTILILIGIAILVALLGAAIMIIGHVDLFGYSFISLNYSTDTVGNEFDVAALTRIDINTSNIDIAIATTTSSKGKYILDVNMQGVVKKEVKDVKFVGSTPHVDDSGCLSIKTSVPEGFFFKNETVLRIYLPESVTNIDNLKLSTGSNDVIFMDKSLTVKNMELIASKSLLNTATTLSSKITVQTELKINAKAGRVIVNSKIEGDLVVDSEMGSIIVNGNVGKDLYVRGKNPFVTIGEIPGTWRNRKDISADDLNALANKHNVAGDVVIDNLTDGGNVKISGSARNVEISDSELVEFWANEITGVITCNQGSNNLRVFGSLGSGATANTSVIKTADGSLFINGSHCKLDVTANKGDVYINNAYNDVKINSKNGSSVVNFSELALDTATVDITNERWNIEVTNIKNTATLNAKSGSVKATFLKVCGDNKIFAFGNIKTYIKDESQFKLVASSKLNTGKLHIVVSPEEYTDWSGAVQGEGDYRYKSLLVRTTDENIGNVLLLQITGNDKITAKLCTEFPETL